MSDRLIRDAATPEEALGRLTGGSVQSARRVAGGCIAGGSRVETDDGRAWFVKRSSSLPPDMFRAEADGLLALAGAATGPRVPTVFAVGGTDRESFLVIEWVEEGRRRAGFGRDFGRRLACMHRELRSSQCGFHADNYIGSTPQPNGPLDSWIEFFATRRIGFQTRLAVDRGVIDAATARRLERLCERLVDFLPEPDRPSLLHGDLWSGNYLVDAEGRAVVIDPAVSFGHREADLAMTRLFGGFPADFYDAYHEEWPLEPGHEERVDLYNLYHLLNHANLFGGGYVANVRAVLSRFE